MSSAVILAIIGLAVALVTGLPAIILAVKARNTATTAANTAQGIHDAIVKGVPR